MTEKVKMSSHILVLTYLICFNFSKVKIIEYGKVLTSYLTNKLRSHTACSKVQTFQNTFPRDVTHKNITSRLFSHDVTH